MTKFCIVGEKLSHTLSPQIHKQFFSLTNIDGEYSIKSLSKEEILLSKNELLSFDGMNVTVPYKEVIMQMLDTCSEEAMRIFAVNTIKNIDGKLCGFNTDPFGFEELLKFNNVNPQNKKCVILGDGGACKSIYFVLEKLCAKEIKIATRKTTKSFDKFIAYSELASYQGDILINTTPVGMYPDCESSPINESVIENFETVIDIIYNPNCTKLLKNAIQHGKRCANGLYMLVSQAIKSQEIWQSQEFEKSIVKNIYSTLRRDYFASNKGNLFLTGMMGSGKSTVGRLLASKTGRKFFDMDTYIEKITSKTIEQLFDEGECVFRKAEQKAVEELSLQENAVIACGGGAILDDKNVMTMRLGGMILFLNREIKNIYIDSAIVGRPLLNKNKIEDIFESRKNKYFSTCDFVIDNNTSPLECVNKIMKI